MVSQASSTTAKKRQKTTDMAESPPKRVTRARAKASVDSELKTTKITTASARIAAENKTPAKPVKTSKRKPKVDHTITILPRDSTEGDVQPEAQKARGRPKRSIDEPKQEVPAAIEPPRPRSTRKDKIVPDEKSSVPLVPKTRGRLKREIETEVRDVLEKEDDADAKPTLTTRTRGGTIKVKPATATTSKPQTMKKKVTFQEDLQQDKENLPIPFKTTKKPQPDSVGLKAKPVRKPTAPKTSIRGEKIEIPKAKEGIDLLSVEPLKPLSPKKVTQVAKSSSLGSEDELGGEDSTPRALNKSPIKPPRSIIMINNDISLENDQTVPIVSPIRGVSSSITASPPRRLPLSPFKDSFKESPKRVNITSITMQSMRMPAQTPLKASLLQSPARRPTSPFKISALGSPSKSSVAIPVVDAINASKTVNDFKLPAFTPQKLLSGAFKAAKSPERSTKHQNTTPMLQEATNSDLDDHIDQETYFVQGTLTEETLNQQSSTGATIADETCLMASPEPRTPFKVSDDAVWPDSLGLTAVEEQTKELANGTSDASVTSPCESSTALPHTIFALKSQAFREVNEESDSEDELQSSCDRIMVSPLRRYNIAQRDFASVETPKRNLGLQHGQHQNPNSLRSQVGEAQKQSDVSITPLAAQLSSWLASSPEKKSSRTHQSRFSSLFNQDGAVVLAPQVQHDTPSVALSPLKSTFFEDEMAIRDQESNAAVEQSEACANENMDEPNDVIMADAGDEHQEAEQYGDENSMPIDPQILGLQTSSQTAPKTCTPARVFQSFPREIHTVSKVPLRPAGDESPIKVSRKRSRSVSGPLSVIEEPSRPFVMRSNSVISYSPEEDSDKLEIPAQDTVPGRTILGVPSTPSQDAWSNFGSAVKPVRTGADAQILRGAVVFVDVHTTEGADASGIFVELLTQMGARCVKNWTWNPRVSIGNVRESTTPGTPASEETPSRGRVGITHVVFKDGGKRSLEKVRETKGLVLCVGVGWVLDCERENKWLDESDYAIDTSLIPRGGHRRRKSMEPRALFNVNGNLIPAETPARLLYGISPSKEFLNLSSPVSPTDAAPTEAPAPETPMRIGQDFGEGESLYGSPTTPYYLSKGAELIQQTCPPKQTMQLLFPLSGNIQDQPDERVRQRLILARRKSLQWAPKIGSPLGRAVSYGK